VKVAGGVPPLRPADFPEVYAWDAKHSYSQLGRSRWRNPQIHPQKSKRLTSAISAVGRSPKASPAAPRSRRWKTHVAHLTQSQRSIPRGGLAPESAPPRLIDHAQSTPDFKARGSD